MAHCILIGGAMVALGLAGVPVLPDLGAQTGAVAFGEKQSEAQPHTGLASLLQEDGEDIGLVADQWRAEHGYLNLQPKTGSSVEKTAQTKNVPYRHCERVPEVLSDAFGGASFEAYARRMFYSYAQMRRVLDTGDCTCAGKVAPFSDVTQIENNMAARDGADWNRRVAGREYITRARAFRSQVEAMCGGEF